MKIVLLENPTRPLPAAVRRELLRLLRGHEVSSRPTPRTRRLSERIPAVDLVIAIGGDGSVLAAAHLTRGRGVPILGFNTGHVGFLAGVSTDNFREEIPLILKGRKVVENRVALRVEMPSGRSGWALNDISLQMCGRDLFTAQMSISGQEVCRYAGDGLVVSSATGSTAYNLSLGGPLLAPDSEMLVVTPKAPLTLTNRSLVLDAPRAIALMLTGRRTRVDADGIPVGHAVAGDTIYVHRTPVTVPLVFPAGHNHYTAVGHKLRWNDRSITR